MPDEPHCLTEALAKVEQRDAWAAPAGILATIVVVFPTATFQDFVISKDTWRAMFIIAAVLSLPSTASSDLLASGRR